MADRGNMAAATTSDNGSAREARDDLTGINAAFHFDRWASETDTSASTLIYDASKFLFGYSNK
jgi:hypothetical protein